MLQWSCHIVPCGRINQKHAVLFRFDSVQGAMVAPVGVFVVSQDARIAALREEVHEGQAALRSSQQQVMQHAFTPHSLNLRGL